MRIILAFEDNELTPQEKAIILLTNFYRTLPNNTEYAVVKANEFLNGGKSDDEETISSPRLYSFSKDANFIYAAFRQTHGVDLNKDNLHWWIFLALFMDLGQDTTFCNLVSLRKRIKTGKASKEEKAAAREMGDILEVPEVDDRTLEEKEIEKEFFRKVQEAQQRNKI